MNDFLDCCYCREPGGLLNQDRVCVRCRIIKERDDARLEADRLRGELARLAKERDEAEAEVGRVSGGRDALWVEIARLTKERDGAAGDINQLRADVARLCHERDEATAEVGRLRKAALESALARAERLKATLASLGEAAARITASRPVEMRPGGEAALIVPLREFLASLPAGSSMTFKAGD